MHKPPLYPPTRTSDRDKATNQAQAHEPPPPSSLIRPHFLRKIEVDHAPVMVLAGGRDHGRRDTAYRHTSRTILDLVQQPVILALGDRVLSLVRLGRGLERLGRAGIAGLGHDRRTSAATRSRRVLVVGRILGMMRAGWVGAVGATRVLAVFGGRADFADDGALAVLFASATMLASARPTNLRDAIARHNRTQVIVFGQLCNIKIIDQVVIVVGLGLVAS